MKIKIARWSKPLVNCLKRYIGIKGGRGGGKSHFIGEYTVIRHIADPNRKTVCIREVQRSLKFSSKALIEQKIKKLGASKYFDIFETEIRRKNGDGLIIFQGMQDHTADSIKSLEGFDCAWVEEAQNLSARSLKLLRPTLRNKGSQIYFTWNPDQKDDPVDDFMLSGIQNKPERFELIHVNFDQNPFISDDLLEEAEYDRQYNPDSYDHVWLGEYNEKSDAQVFKGKWAIEEFEPGSDWDIYHGLDFGFANDPLSANSVHIYDDTLYIRHEAHKVGLELDHTSDYLKKCIPGIENYVIRADNARPESISYLKRHGLPKIKAVEKGKGSVEDGIAHMKSFKRIVIHPECEHTAREFRLYSYKIDKHTGDILPEIEDANNHHIDGIRYALEPRMKQKRGFFGRQHA